MTVRAPLQRTRAISSISSPTTNAPTTKAEGPLERAAAIVNQLGQPLDSQTRSFMESRFRHDFGFIRTHADSEAVGSARELHAASPVAPLGIQPKLAVGSIDDPYEREADQAAARVMRMADADVRATGATGLQRKCSCAQEDHKCACDQEDESTKTLRRQAESRSSGPTSGGHLPPAPPVVHQVLDSAGAPLDRDTRAFFEPRFAYDFSRVRVHSDQLAAQSATAVGAAAYTAGSHIAFATGRYAPTTVPGRWLLAHELAHVVQQRAGPSPLRRQPDLDAALQSRDWQKAAEILNGFNAESIQKALGNLNRGVVASIHAAALDNPRVGPDSAIARETRAAYLDLNYKNELAKQQWTEVAKFLNGFNASDITTRLKTLSDDQVQKIHDGALVNPEVGDKSNVASAAAQELSSRKAAPATAAAKTTAAPTACAKPYAKASSFQQMIDLVKAAEAKLAAAGITAGQDQIHALRGIYYGTTSSLDFSVEKSTTRNEGFQRFTRPSQEPAKSVPPDVTGSLDCGLFKALQDSQDLVDPSGRHVDFGHLIIALDARSDPAFGSNIKYPVSVGPFTKDIDLGGTGTELVTWIGDLGGGAGSLAVKRVTAPSTSASTVFTGSDYGGSINLEGDVAGSVVATGSPTAVTAPTFAPGKGLSDALQDYLSPAAPSPAWKNRATTFLTMNGATFDASGALSNRAALIARFASKIQEFACNYITSRVKDGKMTPADAKKAASSHVVSSAQEVATTFVDALADSHKSGGKIEATRFPSPSAGGAAGCTIQVMAAGALAP